jgi:hypothetical protein
MIHTIGFVMTTGVIVVSAAHGDWITAMASISAYCLGFGAGKYAEKYVR